MKTFRKITSIAAIAAATLAAAPFAAFADEAAQPSNDQPGSSRAQASEPKPQPVRGVSGRRSGGGAEPSAPASQPRETPRPSAPPVVSSGSSSSNSPAQPSSSDQPGSRRDGRFYQNSTPRSEPQQPEPVVVPPPVVVQPPVVTQPQPPVVTTPPPAAAPDNGQPGSRRQGNFYTNPNSGNQQPIIRSQSRPAADVPSAPVTITGPDEAPADNSAANQRRERGTPDALRYSAPAGSPGGIRAPSYPKPLAGEDAYSAKHRVLTTPNAYIPENIKIPEQAVISHRYTSNRPYRDYRDTWNECRTYDRPKREFWNRYVCRPAVSYNYYYGYQYWPSSSYSYYYWSFGGYPNTVNVVYAPPRTEYIVVDGGTDVYSSDSVKYRGNNYSGYAEDKRDAERVMALIGQAWRTEDPKAFSRYLERDLPIRLYRDGQFLYSMDTLKFVDYINDSMRRFGTQRFDIDDVVPVRPGEVHVYCRHELNDPRRDDNTQYERYTLERVGREWMISAYDYSDRRLN